MLCNKWSFCETFVLGNFIPLSCGLFSQFSQLQWWEEPQWSQESLPTIYTKSLTCWLYSALSAWFLLPGLSLIKCPSVHCLHNYWKQSLLLSCIFFYKLFLLLLYYTWSGRCFIQMIHSCGCPHIRFFDVIVFWSSACQDALPGYCTGKIGSWGREIRLGGAQEYILESCCLAEVLGRSPSRRALTRGMRPFTRPRVWSLQCPGLKLGRSLMGLDQALCQA